MFQTMCFMKLWIPKFQEFELGNFQTFTFCELWEVPLCSKFHGNYKTYFLEGIVSQSGPSYDESNVNLQLSYVPILIPIIRNTFLHLVCVMDVIKTGWMRIVLSRSYLEAPMWLVILICQAMECVQDSNMLFIAHHINELSSIPFDKLMEVCQITQTRARKWFLLSKLESKQKTITNSHWNHHDPSLKDPPPSF
jgi:hypothetical protein